MCGIIAVWNKKKSVCKEKLKKATDTLYHRGPDSNNSWISKDKHVGLAHTRLSIIGLDNGQQPVFNAEKGIYAIVNGEFYDYQEIRKSFESSGYKFTTDTDSEIIIPLYLKYGTNLFDKLNGEYAFVLWDDNQKKMICARDRFGIKPLSYAFDEKNFYVASEIKALIALGVKAKWDEYSSSMIFQGMPLLDTSCFKNIKQVRPGHFLEITKDNAKETEYWNFNYQDNDIKYSDEEYILLFRDKLTKAIKRRLVADVPVGFYLSGGIDSSSVLAISSQLSKNIQAFNISFDHKDFDENKFAKEIAKSCNVNLSSINVSEQAISDSFSSAILHREGFVYQLNGVAKYILSKHVYDNGYKVVLTGEGSDEILAGYPSFIEDMINCLQTNERDSLFKQLKLSREKTELAFLSNGKYDHSDFKAVKAKLGYIPSAWKMNFDLNNLLKSVYSNTFKAKSLNTNPMLNFLAEIPINNLLNTHPVNKSTYFFCKSILPEVILSYLGDRMEMAHSIEGRLPFLDVELVEFANMLPINLKIRKIKEKYILYEAVKDIVPKNIYNRNKQIFETPKITSNLNRKSPVETHIHDVIHSSDFSDLPFFNQGKTIKLFNEIRKMEKRNSLLTESSFNLILSAYYLKKHFINA